MGKKEQAVKRVVLDTNVIVSACLFKGSLSRLVELWKRGDIVPCISKETFSELRMVLDYQKFALTSDEVKTIIEDEILPYFDVVEIEEKVNGVCRDSFDDMFLSVAVSAGVPWIVTGDKDLLELGKYGVARIVTPNEFLKRVVK